MGRGGARVPPARGAQSDRRHHRNQRQDHDHAADRRHARARRRAERRAGNVGNALSTLAGRIEPGRTIVCELSSFQLEGIEGFRSDVAVLLNVTPDHLDRHGSFEAYAAAKLRVFERQRESDTAILCVDDAYVAALDDGYLPGSGRRVRVSGTVLENSTARSSPTRRPSCACSSASARADTAVLCVDDAYVAALSDADVPGDATKLRVSGADLGTFEEAFAASRLRGPHNRANTACAIAVARALGADEAGRRCTPQFAAPAHRMEQIRELRGVRYVNDSKATNVEATLQALASFDAPLHVILGGSLKGAGFAPLAAPLAHGARPCTWNNENGPNGGDEINVILPGRSYGWPLLSFGREYPVRASPSTRRRRASSRRSWFGCRR